MTGRDANLALDGVRKRFGDREVVSDVSLEVGAGELMALLGPSGAGKTTILRCIGGHVKPDGGEIRIGGESVAGVPPERRDVGMVFQNYALFPHLTARQNVAFGPERRGATRAESLARADALLERVGLRDRADRRPEELSGGERQRTAAARALAIRPSVLLLDEPLASLDPPRRRDLRARLRQLQREEAITTLWVTHDQEEALSVADRVAVLANGRIQQTGTPRDLYSRPASSAIAAFVGRMNLIPAVPETEAGAEAWRLVGGPVVRVDRGAGNGSGAAAGEGREALVGMRPEAVRIGHPPPLPGFNAARAEVRRISWLGDRLEIALRLEGGHEVLARGNALFESTAREGESAPVYWRVEDTLVF